MNALDYHPSDSLLRRHGYRIHARPNGALPVWRSAAGQLVEEPNALEDAQAREAVRRQAAKAREQEERDAAS